LLAYILRGFRAFALTVPELMEYREGANTAKKKYQRSGTAKILCAGDNINLLC
jgi:hypothetical protein